MRINPSKEETKGSGFLAGIFVIFFIAFPILGKSQFQDDPFNFWLVLIIFLILFIFCGLDVTVKTFAYFILDEEKITEHLLFYSKTVFWDECKFIGTYSESGRSRVLYVTCSKKPFPYTRTQNHNREGKVMRTIYNQFSSQNIKFLRSIITDEQYQQFLNLCGGERDLP